MPRPSPPLALLVLALAAADARPASTLYGIGSSFQDASSNLYRIDDHGGAPKVTDVGETGLWMCDLAVDPTSGRMFGITCADLGVSTELFELNPSDGSATLVGKLGVSLQNGLEFDVNGDLWSVGVGGSGAVLHRIDVQTGQATAVGPLGANSGGDLAFGIDGTLWMAGHDALYRVNTGTGAATLVGPFGVADVVGLDVDEDGQLILGRGVWGGAVELHRVNPTTGAATPIGPVAGSVPVGIGGLSFAGAVGVTYEGDGLGQVLGIEWTSGPPGAEAKGTITVDGGTPNDVIAILIGLKKLEQPLGNVTLLVDPTGAVLLTVPLDAQGSVGFPADLDLLQSFADLHAVMIQAISNLVAQDHETQLMIIHNLRG
ncbi:MAG: DUF6923 family protein [Planctomycetota bacterium JB042]